MNIPANPGLTAEQFIHQIARLSVAWGMPHTAARVSAYLLLQSKPASLDQIAAALDISKASAWGATRHLEQVHQVERFGEPGSKRALFAPAMDFARTLSDYGRLLGKTGALMREGAAVVDGSDAAARLLEQSEFYLAVHEAIDSTLEELNARRGQAMPAGAKKVAAGRRSA
jgi:hypothetical protein